MTMARWTNRWVPVDIGAAIRVNAFRGLNAAVVAVARGQEDPSANGLSEDWTYSRARVACVILESGSLTSKLLVLICVIPKDSRRWVCFRM